MFCSIREIPTRKTREGESKKLNVWTSQYGDDPVKYHYSRSDDKFIRPPRPSYEITIQKSYREDGRVKKKRWKICTLNYYDFVDGYGYWADSLLRSEVDRLLEETKLTHETLGVMIEAKLDPIIEQIQAEYEQTEEFIIHKENERITNVYAVKKIQFEEVHGKDTYDYIYDVFGELRNPDHLEKVKRDKESSKEYQQKSQEQQYKQFEDYFNNYGGGASQTGLGNHSEGDKIRLKKFYRTLSKQFHPDKGGTTEDMMLINEIKEEWGV